MFTIDQSTGESLMRWTVRIAVLLVLIRAAYRLRTRPSPVPTTAECWLWGGGLLAYLAHVLFAFQFVHGWSHENAWQHTAGDTARVTGVRRGDGLWVNYLFTALWIGDQSRLVLARLRRRSTSRGMDFVVFALFAFMILNATVVFGSMVYRILAIPTVIILGWSWRAGARGGIVEPPVRSNE